MTTGPRKLAMSARSAWSAGRLLAKHAFVTAPTLTTLLWLVAIIGATLPLVEMWVTSQIVGTLSESGERRAVIVYVAAFGIVFVGAQLAPLVELSLARVVGDRIETRLVDQLIGYIASDNRVDRRWTPEFMAASSAGIRMRSATFLVADAVQAMVRLVGGRVLGAVCVVLLVGFHWWVPFVLVATFLVWDAYFRGEYRAQSSRWTERDEEQERSRYFESLVYDRVGHRESRIFGFQRYVLAGIRDHAVASERASWSIRRPNVRRIAAVALVVASGYAAAFLALGKDLSAGVIDSQQATLYALLVTQVWRIVPGFSDLARLTLGSVPVLAWQAAEQSAPPNDAAKVLLRPAAPGALNRTSVDRKSPVLTVESVSYTYPGHGRRPALRDVSLVIPACSSLGIVGANGAGKSTLVNMLIGVTLPDEGRVVGAGIDLGGINLQWWLDQIAYVPQDSVHLPLSVRSNLTTSREGRAVSPEALAAAVRLVGASSVIDQLPRGFDTVLAADLPDGVDLSGGQWQRLVLARAMARILDGASVLVLDEPTSNLDARTEFELFRSVLHATPHQTTVLVTHRLSNVREVDYIVVLDDGRILEQGSHAELLRRGGRYAADFRTQAGAFNITGEA